MCSWHGRAAHLELDQAGESAQMKATDVGLVPLFCYCLPWVPGDSCWVCPSMIMTPTSKYSNIDFTFVCPH